MKESDKKSVALSRIELLIVKVDGHMRTRGSVKFVLNIKVCQLT